VTLIQIIRKKLDPSEVGGANTRYDDSCDCTQSSPDGGTTWIDNPAIDPRHSPTLQMPARTTSDPQCDAAANMVAYLRKFIDTITTVATQGAGASAILGVLVVFMPEVAILWTLALEIMGGLLAIGQSTINAAFTDPVYDQIENIFYCNINSDGTVTAEQLDTIGSEIADVIGGVVQAVMALYLPLVGEVGLTNAGATGSEVGDCSGFVCGWCYDFHDGTGLEDWSVGATGLGVYSGGVWDGTASAGAQAADIIITFTATGIDTVTAYYSTTGNDGNRPTIILYLLGTQVNRADATVSTGTPATHAAHIGVFTTTTCDEIRVFMASDTGHTCQIDQVVVRGSDINPFGDSNCI